MKEENKNSIDFDQLCKRLIKAFFKEFLEFFFPKLVEKIDFSSVEFLDKELYSGQLEGEKAISDLLAKVKLIDDTEEIILIHTEIQSDKDIDFPLRMFEYFLDIWKEYRQKIFAFALFIDDTVKWNPPIKNTYNLEFMGSGVKYKYHLKKTKSYNYRKYLNHENPITAALITKMNYGNDSKALVKAQALRKMKKYNLSPLQREILLHFIDRILCLNHEEKKEFVEILKKEKKFQEVKAMMTTWEEEAMEKGIEKGIEKGKLEVAKQLFNRGISLEEIADIIQLSLETIKKSLM